MGEAPGELTARRQWVVFRFEDGRKPPYQPRHPQTNASATNPRTWGSIDEAREVVDGGEADGIGYALTTDDRVVFIDLAGSFWIPPGAFGHRLLRRLTELYYEANVIKWETLLHPGGDPREGMKKPPRYRNGLHDLRMARKRLRDRKKSSVSSEQ